jgi:DNA-binding winged helix-turn-helix (wHTH) protein
MEQTTDRVYEFGPFRLHSLRRVLLRDESPVALTARVFDTLVVLVERRGRVVAKDELMAALWPDTAVEENNLTQHVSMLRKALGERAGAHRYVVTVPGRGYSFVEPVREGAEVSPSDMALVHDSLGERERAYEWMSKARDKARTNPEAANMLKADPRLDGLRADPRFRDIFIL